jgi:hypothetical protein
MWSLSYGTVPDRERFLTHCAARVDEGGEPDPVDTYPMKIVNQGEWSALASAINQRIDAHLEAVVCEERAYGQTGSGYLTIKDPGSLHTLIRRLVDGASWDEDGPDPGLDLASSILYTIGIEWI